MKIKIYGKIKPYKFQRILEENNTEKRTHFVMHPILRQFQNINQTFFHFL